MWFRRKQATQLDLTELQEQVRKLHTAMRTLSTDFERLEDQYMSLRGYVYAKKGLVGPPGEAPPGDAPPVHGSPLNLATPLSERDKLRAELVRSGRFVPGQKPRHES